jgi:hypothetical protein
MVQLPRASVEWQRRFPHAPSLPSLLAEMSCAPRPYKNFVPSKAHRPLYLHMLAWLLRGGWVTQLCTFAYVVVWPEIVYEIAYQTEADELRKTEGSVDSTTDATDATNTTATPPPLDNPSSRSSPPTAETIAERARLDRLATRAQRDAAEKAVLHARKPKPVATDHPSVNAGPHLDGIQPHIIRDPRRAAGRESLYLSAIEARLKKKEEDGNQAGQPQQEEQEEGQTAGLGLTAAWRRFLRYFDGQTALERITLQEDLKRKEAWTLLSAMGEYILCVRHW